MFKKYLFYGICSIKLNPDFCFIKQPKQLTNMQTQELTQIQILGSDVFDVASEPHISIDFNKDGQQFFIEIAAQDALNFLQAAGRYSYERFSSDSDGNYFVYEFDEGVERDVKVVVEHRLLQLEKRDLDAIVRKALVCPDYRDAIEEILF